MKRPKGVPPAVIPIVVVGLAIAAVWGGYSLLEPAGAGEPKANDGAANAPRESEADAQRETDTINSGIEALTSAPQSTGRKGLLSEALDQGRNDPAERAVVDASPADGAPVGPLPETSTPHMASKERSQARFETTPAIDDTTPPIQDPVAQRPSASSSSGVLDRARALISQNDLLGAREMMSQALADPMTSASGREALRAELMELNETLVFGPRIIPGDPMVEEYVVESGDTLGKIARKRELGVHWKLIQRVNRISRPEKIRVGQRLKLVRGPFNAVVNKSEFRVDIYHGPPSEPSRWVYITSRAVGLGESGSTPLGTFVVREGSKLENPAWVNPRDGREQYGRDDPKNPIGEHWIGLEGLGDASAYEGYGLHGTIEPDSIGKQMSMGCVRLLEDDIALLYELLEEGISIVKIVP
ncbi:MAG: LysM peptidoglycan-binding domain-containing protein [Phycisphaerales bacterium]